MQNKLDSLKGFGRLKASLEDIVSLDGSPDLQQAVKRDLDWLPNLYCCWMRGAKPGWVTVIGFKDNRAVYFHDGSVASLRRDVGRDILPELSIDDAA